MQQAMERGLGKYFYRFMRCLRACISSYRTVIALLRTQHPHIARLRGLVKLRMSDKLRLFSLLLCGLVPGISTQTETSHSGPALLGGFAAEGKSVHVA